MSGFFYMKKNNKIKILIADKISLDSIYKFFPRSEYQLDLKFGITNEEIVSDYKDHDVLIIRSVRKINKEFIRQTEFKIIATCSRGHENIDSEYAAEKGIVIFNTDKGNSIAAAEHTIGMIISLYKNFELSKELIVENKFTFNNFQRNELNVKIIGIIGFGNIGSMVAKISKAFGMKVLVNDISKSVIEKNKKHYNFVTLKNLLSKSDIVTLHIPGDSSNENFVSEKEFSIMKKNTIIVNTSRGNVIKENDLIKYLQNKNIRGAAIDVFKNEPVINKKYLKLHNVLLTNHIAGKTEESAVKMAHEIYKKVSTYFTNKK